MRMLTRVSLSAVLFGMLLVAAPSAALLSTANAEEFTSEKGNYKITFPGKSTGFEQKIDTEAGPTVSYMQICETPNAAFLISYNDFAEDAAKTAKPADVLTGVMNSVVASTKGKLQKSADIMLDGHPGKSFSFAGDTAGKKMEGHARSYFVGARLYQVMVLGEAGKLKPEEIEKFLGSFSRIKK